MIETQIISAMKNDTALAALLGASALNTKIYPTQSGFAGEPPFLLYNTASEGTIDENLKVIDMYFTASAEEQSASKAINDRVLHILDIENRAQRSLSNSNYFIYWSKAVGGAEFSETDLNLHNHSSVIQFKFNRISGEVDYLLTEDGLIIDTEDGKHIALEAGNAVDKRILTEDGKPITTEDGKNIIWE